MTEKSNAALIRAIHAHVSRPSNPASMLMDVLGIGREAAYRRLRGEVPFTFDEAGALSTNLHFSLDRVMGASAEGNVLFSLKFTEFSSPLELYDKTLEHDARFFREVASDPTTVFASATNSIPAEYYLKYENLTRFKLFKWLYQHEIGDDITVSTFEDLALSDSLRRHAREYVQGAQMAAQTNIVFDDSGFVHWLNAIRAFRDMHLISEPSIAVLREELLELLGEFERMAVEGEYENGNRVGLYLSEVDLEAAYTYVSSERYKVAGIGLFSLNAMRTDDPTMFEYVCKWVRTQGRFATLISRSGELQRIRYFKGQRDIIAGMK